MDIHTVDSEDFSVEDVVTAHMEDLAVQEKFGVIQIKYWVDTDNKKIFCLMEGPSKEACNAVHLESHGNTACNIIEVSDDEYNLFLNIGKKKNDLAQTNSGTVDPGFRTFLLTNTTDFTGKYNHYTNQIYKIIESYDGINIAQASQGILASFMNTISGVICAVKIEKLLRSVPDSYEYRMAIVTGNPVDIDGNSLFEETKNKINTLGKIGLNSKIYIDAITKSIIIKEPKAPKLNSEIFIIVGEHEYSFLEKIVYVFNTQLHNPDFNLGKLNAALGLSKAQSYRKIKSITGLAPNQLIQELRLRQSIGMLKKNTKTVAEIAYDLGFNSPTYFTRVFRKRFQILPTSLIKLSIK
jgi:AraC-like DNA-binding protein